jgi:hypothetical protein
MTRFALVVASIATIAVTYMTVAALRDPSEADALDYSTSYDPELHLVLVVSPSCVACGDPIMPELWSRAVATAEAEAERKGIVLTKGAVAVSRSPESGVEFLRRFGPFHEVSAGRSWQGLGARHYVFETLPGPPEVPQVILLERQASLGSDGRPSIREQVLSRATGLEGITRWALR